VTASVGFFTDLNFFLLTPHSFFFLPDLPSHVKGASVAPETYFFFLPSKVQYSDFPCSLLALPPCLFLKPIEFPLLVEVMPFLDAAIVIVSALIFSCFSPPF